MAYCNELNRKKGFTYVTSKLLSICESTHTEQDSKLTSTSILWAKTVADTLFNRP